MVVQVLRKQLAFGLVLFVYQSCCDLALGPVNHEWPLIQHFVQSLQSAQDTRNIQENRGKSYYMIGNIVR